MNILKVVLFVIAIIIAIPLIAALFIRKDFNIEREITINKPTPVVFSYLSHLKNQDNFSKWVMTDPGMKRDFKGTDGTVGFVYAWDSKMQQAGKGEQEIMNIKNNELVDVEVRFEKPFKNVAKTPFITEALSATQTKVRWGMQGKNKYPINVMNLFMGNMLGKDIETSLVNLKSILEKS